MLLDLSAPGALHHVLSGTEFQRLNGHRRLAAAGGHQTTAVAEKEIRDVIGRSYCASGSRRLLFKPLPAVRRRVMSPSSQPTQGRRVAIVLVPPENVTPFAFQYIERSTTIGTSLATSTATPNDESFISGTSFTSTMKRPIAGTV